MWVPRLTYQLFLSSIQDNNKGLRPTFVSLAREYTSKLAYSLARSQINNHMSIPLPSKPKIIKKADNLAILRIEGLYPGYGITIGNTIRRVLLSSLEGAAVTQVKIKGVSHEFSTLEGVLEDIIMITLNLKKIRFKMFSDEPQTATLSVKGEKSVTAKDFKVSSEIEIVNPDLHIATITKSSTSLEMEVLVEKGIGYQRSENRIKEKAEVGVLPLDAIFTPIVRVSLAVENMRVGKKTDFDRLDIEVQTDGTITPEEAISRSLAILLNHFSLLDDNLGEKELEKKPAEKKEKAVAKKKTAKKKTVKKTMKKK